MHTTTITPPTIPASEFCICDDPWLSTLAARRRTGAEWSHAVVAGLCCRLQRLSTERKQSVVRALLTRDSEHDCWHHYQWASSLDEDQRGWLLDLTRTSVDRLHDCLCDIRLDLEAGLVDATDWQIVCRLRDDIECVVHVLDAQALDLEILAVDAFGARLRDRLPRSALQDDERWQRVRQIGDGAFWWARH